ncbi:MAG: IS66 family insertion sequence element accessory protein TnpB [Gammaproteobacteria bacterium]|nr:IS66 family insertion sequence element accessory protein TnpB [Gammaproteobacteria bacterium]
MIRVDAIWMSTAPCDMRRGMDTLMNQIITVFGAVQTHNAYLFANRGANRMKVIVHDGFGVWLCSRRLHKGSFNWGKDIDLGESVTLSSEQFNALIVGLPWQRLGEYSSIKYL